MPSDRYVLNSLKEPVPLDDLQLWGAYLEDKKNMIVKQETVIELGDLISPFEHPWISTVFLAMDYNFLDNGPPILFETMVFGGPFDQQQWRYATHDEALEGHEKVVERVKSIEKNIGMLWYKIGQWWEYDVYWGVYHKTRPLREWMMKLWKKVKSWQ